MVRRLWVGTGRLVWCHNKRDKVQIQKRLEPMEDAG